jgi:hypothetical protein
MAKPFTKVSGQQIIGSLARKFVPLADSLRDLFTKFGLRPYTVKMVRVAWSGIERGVGMPQVESETLIEPTPKITDFTALQEVLQPVGLDEIGGILVSEISGRYTEDELRGLKPGETEIPPNVEFFYEIEYPRADNGPVTKRRFFPRSAPAYESGALQWSLRLEKTAENRALNGDPE